MWNAGPALLESCSSYALTVTVRQEPKPIFKIIVGAFESPDFQFVYTLAAFILRMPLSKNHDLID